MSLKEKTMKMNSGNGIDFMKGREKGEMEKLIDRKVTIEDYGFINGDDGEYVVFIIKEDSKNFYFGGKVLTLNLKELSEEEHEELKNEGLPVLFNERKSKKTKKTYVSTTFYPDEELPEELPF